MSALALAPLADGRLQTFFVDGGNSLWSQWQVDDGSGQPDWGQITLVDPSPGAVTSVAVTAGSHGGVTGSSRGLMARLQSRLSLGRIPMPDGHLGRAYKQLNGKEG
jgi:hypothetical protein